MRTKGGIVTRQRRRKWLKLAKGYFGHKSVGFKVAKQQVIKSWTYAFRDRKQVKRNFRKLWISRISASVRPYQLNYSQFMNGLKKSDIEINRKMLSELAIHKPQIFEKIVLQVQEQLNKEQIR